MSSNEHQGLNPDTVKDDRTRMKEHFEVPHDQHTSRWSNLWDAKTFLPWDKGFAAPSLVDLLDSPVHSHLFSSSSSASSAMTSTTGASSSGRKRALVPGCGRGYDVLLFAQHGYDAVGVEVAEKAVESAKQFIAEEEEKTRKSNQNGEIQQQGKAEFVVGDFFQDSWLHKVGVEAGQWDVIYDYTFLCALPPTFRPKWAARMKSLLKPGGLLICLEFPLYKDPATGGPPFGLTSEIYCDLLGSASSDGADGSDVVLERIVHEKPKRFHAISKETDMITIWKKSDN